MPAGHQPISVALHDSTLTDAPDAPARPVSVLARLAAEANRHTDETHYELAGRGLGAVLSELHTHVAADTGEDRGYSRQHRTQPHPPRPDRPRVCRHPAPPRRRRVWELDSLCNRFGIGRPEFELTIPAGPIWTRSV
ncbi:MAG: hypothetical protein M3R63_08310 [Actinomycetota bacterium]|nr:hypothetical protein [Actinomycetota bacterium]